MKQPNHQTRKRLNDKGISPQNEQNPQNTTPLGHKSNKPINYQATKPQNSMQSIWISSKKYSISTPKPLNPKVHATLTPPKPQLDFSRTKYFFSSHQTQIPRIHATLKPQNTQVPLSHQTTEQIIN